MADIDVSFALQPKQRQLLKLVESSPYEIIGYGGSAGGAKSHAIRDIALYLGLKHKNINILIFRRLSNDLLENHIIPFFQKYPHLRPFFNKSERIIYLPTGSNIRFGYAEYEDDIFNFQGKQYDYIFVDEATHSTQRMIEFLRTRNRISFHLNTSIVAKMILTMNPGGVGHAYCKRLFIDKIYQDTENADDYYFLPAKIYDNVIWSLKVLKERDLTAKDYYSWTDEKRKDFCYKYSDYAKLLLKLPLDLRAAYLEGDWDVFGGMFFKGFNKNIQIIDPFEIPEGWEFGCSMDPGYASPLSFGFQARDYTGKIYRLYTYYQVDSIPNHVEAINQLINNQDSIVNKFTRGRRPNWIVSGHDAFYKLDKNAIMSNDYTVENFFTEKGLYLEKAVTDRIQGWWKFKSLFPDNYLIFDNKDRLILNKALIDQLSSTVSDTRIVEDILGRGNDNNVEDHAIDEARYGVQRIYLPFERMPDNSPSWLKKLKSRTDNYSVMSA